MSYKNRRLDGESKMYYKSGKLMGVENYKNDKPQMVN
ncbi:hypothetical protein [Chryseobacterium sp. RR2-3-20]